MAQDQNRSKVLVSLRFERSDKKKEVPDLIPVRMLNEFVYCPRLFFMEWVQGDFVESHDTLEGHRQHRRVDKDKGELPPSEDEEIPDFKATSVMLSSDHHGLICKMDLVEGEGGRVSPVDYKKGKRPDRPAGAWDPERVQLCAQGLVLEDNDYDCREGVIYYVKSKERVRIPFDDDLRALTLKSMKALRILARKGNIPPPLDDSRKCPRCSLVGICLPDETNLLRKSRETVLDTEDVRRLIPTSDDALPMYVQKQGAKVGKKGEEITVRHDGKVVASARMIEISQISFFGNIHISPQLIKTLCQRGIPICYFSYGNWFYGITHGMVHKNIDLRIRQFDIAGRDAECVRIARRIVHGKIRNCRTLLKRNNTFVARAALDELDRLGKLALEAESNEILLGIEGSAGRIYFLHFGGMLKKGTSQGDGDDGIMFDFQSRNRRPPKDPVNALLSFLYAVLVKDLTVTLLSVGFDPFLGFYHRPRYGRPSLALDMMEEFRPIIVDSVIVSAINNQEIRPTDFIKRGAGTTLTSEGKKRILSAYERRKDTHVTHPIFGYRISYSRIIEVQARLLARVLNGEIEVYQPFCTR